MMMKMKILNFKLKMERKMTIRFGMKRKIFLKVKNKKMKILKKYKLKMIKNLSNLVNKAMLPN